MKLVNSVTLILLMAVFSACSTPPRATGDVNIEYDLSQYFFHADLTVDGGEVKWVEKYFQRGARERNPIFYPTKWQVRKGKSIEEYAQGLDGVGSEYVITENTIKQARPSFNDSRTLKRYAKIGETYVDNVYSQIPVAEKCVLQNHFSQYDIPKYVRSTTVSERSRNDVIQVHCISTFVADGNSRPNYEWNKYYAKGVGLILIEGDWHNLHGSIVAIPEY